MKNDEKRDEKLIHLFITIFIFYFFSLELCPVLLAVILVLDFRVLKADKRTRSALYVLRLNVLLIVS